MMSMWSGTGNRSVIILWFKVNTGSPWVSYPWAFFMSFDLSHRSREKKFFLFPDIFKGLDYNHSPGILQNSFDINLIIIMMSKWLVTIAVFA